MLYPVFRWACGLLFGLALCHCGGDSSALVRAQVAERVDAFRSKEMQECQLGLLEKAERAADSLLILEAINSLNDSLARLRPGRPFRPAPIPPIDSMAVKPLFDQ